jgi:hypothetical protein
MAAMSSCGIRVRSSVGNANRFDAPGGEFGVLYAAADIEAAFVETVLRRNGRLIRREKVAARAWVEIALARPMRVARLHGDGLLWHGQDASISTASDYRESRALSLALHEDFPDLDGIAYRSRHDNDRMCYAFFDRAGETSFVRGAGASFGDDWPLAEALMARYGASWDPTPSP